MMKDGIKINNHCGTWYVVDQDVFHRPKIVFNKIEIENIPVYFLESEIYGDEAAWLVIDDDLNVILEEVWNGKEDLREYEDMLEWERSCNA